ncbi:hypothetical protein CHS0354_031307 [Potamilus streckersoni]|uniref:IgGFc-binding protein N-terminal domain-containing protein n=1 Tax=Potamilus streckersoni TaxID=2493646 RepID=A0AAE0TCG8_9BIVA|nr:hypothetical protein CHS0354_031307 [Potamilus streckersoni]
MEEYYDIGDIIMYVAADENTSINVFAPHVNICQTIHIKTKVEMLRLNASLRLRGSELVKKGIHVTSDKPITIYVMSSDNNEDAEGYLALPTSILSTKYMIVTDYGNYDIWNSTSEFVIAAVDSNTVVQISFKTNGTICFNGTCYTSGDLYNITMSELDTLQIQHVHDLTGTFVRSNKPVAVFAGDRCGYGVPGVVQNPACQHEVEQMLPIDILGHDYITTTLYPMEFYRFRIISQFDNTVVFLQGNNYTINSGDFIERLETTPQYIHSSKQIIVMEYGHCHWLRMQINESNPSMITLPPISRYAMNYTFFPVDTFAGTNFISVIIDTNKSKDLMLNFKRLNAIKTYFQGNFTILVARAESPTNTLYHPDPTVKFGAILYGTRLFGSYGFPLGMSNGHAIIPSTTTEKDSTTTDSGNI